MHRATDGHVRDLYWTGDDRPVAEDLSGFAQAPDAAGDPVAYYLHQADLHQVVYRGVDNHIHELYWPGTAPVQWWDLSVHAGAPPADSDPAAFYSASTNTKHIVYRSADRHLHEIWWVFGGAPAHMDLTVEALAPPAVDRPATFTVDGPGSRHVVYRGADNHIHEITWEASPAATPSRQPDWRWCNKCQGLYYGGNVANSRCPTGGTHTPANQSGSANYILPLE